MALAKNEVGPKKNRAVKKRTPRSTTQTTQNSPFFSLPGEVRNAMYKPLLVSYNTIEPRGSWKPKSPSYPSYPFSQYRSTLAIAFTCKQLKDEILSLYYGTNNFRFGSVEEMRKGLEVIGDDARQLLTRVGFNFWGNSRVPGFKALGELRNTKRLQINISRDTPTYFTKFDLFRAAGLKQLKAIRGCEEVVVLFVGDRTQKVYGKVFENADIEGFERMLRKWVCKPRGKK